MVHRTFLTTVITVLVLSVLSCAADSEQALDAYFDETGPHLNRATDAFDAWTVSADNFADADLTSISSADYRELAEQHLGVARVAQRAAREALAGIRVIVPPEACDEIHASLIEALRLSEQGFLEIVSYMQAGLRGVEPDESQRLLGNDLLADSDRTKEEALILMARSPECS